MESLKSLLVKNKTNYVVMETGNTGMIKSTMTTMLNAMALYSVQLVILDPNETLAAFGMAPIAHTGVPTNQLQSVAQINPEDPESVYGV